MLSVQSVFVIWQYPPARYSLLGLAGFLALAASGVGALASSGLDSSGSSVFEALLLTAAGGAIGCIFAGKSMWDCG